jgi:hypothetical protein
MQCSAVLCSHSDLNQVFAGADWTAVGGVLPQVTDAPLPGPVTRTKVRVDCASAMVGTTLTLTALALTAVV